jgi:hypothetical protein
MIADVAAALMRDLLWPFSAPSDCPLHDDEEDDEEDDDEDDVEESSLSKKYSKQGTVFLRFNARPASVCLSCRLDHYQKPKTRPLPTILWPPTLFNIPNHTSYFNGSWMKQLVSLSSSISVSVSPLL